MSWSNLIRQSGLAAIVAGTIFVVSDLMDLASRPAARSEVSPSVEEANPDALLVVQSGLTLLAGVFLLFGLLGLYANRFEEMGIPGLLGFVTAFSGTVMAVGGFWANALAAPSPAHALIAQTPHLLGAGPPRALSAGFTLSYGLITAGWLAFGLAALLSRVYPAFPIGLLVVGAAVTWLPFPLMGVLFGAAVVWLGCVLRSANQSDQDEPTDGKHAPLGYD